MFPAQRNSIVRVRTSVCILVGLCATLGAADLLHAAPGVPWLERFPANSPSPRDLAYMWCDQNLESVVLFGGHYRTGQGVDLWYIDAWRWDGQTWQSLDVDASCEPLRRLGTAQCYDRDRQALIVFGGLYQSIKRNDVWEMRWDPLTLRYSCEEIQLAGGDAPEPRDWARMVHDTRTGTYVLFDGRNAAGQDLNETWSWDAAARTWTLLDGGGLGRPIPNPESETVYDEGRGVAINYSGPYGNTDTFEWDGVAWTQSFPAVNPGPRYHHTMVYDGSSGKVLLFGGGRDFYNLASPDTWAWNGVIWEQILTEGPSSRAEPAMAYDSRREVIVLFGGAAHGPVYFDDTWELNHKDCNNNGTADELDIANCDGSAWCDDCNNNATLDECDVDPIDPDGNGEVSPDDNTNAIPDECEAVWTQRFPTTGPAPRRYHAMAFDETSEVVVLFGGWDGRNRLNDTWLWDGVAWTLAATGGPSPRLELAMAYDKANERVVLFGGNPTSNHGLGDTWVWDGASWTVAATTGPPARYAHTMAYDESRERVVMFGGGVLGGCFGDVWEWNGSTWNVNGANTPPSRAHHAMSYDIARGVTAMFGGRCSGFEGWTETWTWDWNTWAQVALTGPSTREATMVYDKQREVSVLFGGWYYGGLGDTWEWNGVTWNEVATNNPPPRAHHAMAYDNVRGVTVMFGGTDTPSDSLLGDTWEYSPQQPIEDCNNNGIPDEQDIAICDGNAWCGDCNENGLLDACDIEWGDSGDCDSNGIPDECESLSAPLRIAFTGRIAATDPYDVFSMNPDGTDLVNHTANFSAGATGRLAVSPDGRRIAFTAGSPNGIWVINADGTDPQLVRDAGAGGVDTPRWYNSDILFYAYTTSRSCPYSVQIRSISFDGVDWANDMLVVANASAIGQHTTETFDISPDRSKLIWDAQQGCWSPTYDIYICDLVGTVCTNARAFFADPGDDNSDGGPKWATDSQTVYWQHWINPGVVVQPIGIAAKAIDSPRPVTEYDLLYRPDLDCGIPLVYPWFLHDLSPDDTRLLFWAGSTHGVYTYDVASATCVPIRSADYVRDAVWTHLCSYPEPNTPPICDAGGPYEFECSGSVMTIPLSSGSTDPDPGDTLTYAWSTDCPEGGFDDAGTPNPTLTLATTAACTQNYNVFLRVTDEDVASVSCSAPVTVQDTTPPRLANVPPDAIVECDAVPAVVHPTAEDSCDAEPTVGFEEVRNDGLCTDEYTLTRTWIATDACDNPSTEAHSITVVDTVAPTIQCPGGLIAAECVSSHGAEIIFTVTAADTCDPDPLVTCWDAGGNLVESGGTFPIGITVVTCTAEDTCGGFSEPCDFTVDVASTPPVITNLDGAPLLVPVGDVVSFELAFTDTPEDVHTVTWDYGDASLPVTTGAMSPAYSTHAYEWGGIYTASATLTDRCGNQATQSIVLVVYDPSAGFTTGGGWFIPDAESFIDGINVTDTASKANFGFVVKYKKGASNPDGNMEFQYKAGDIDLKSTDMDWMVVQSATKVSFKGLATINDTDELYSFKVTAEDNGEPGSDDTFQIEIWLGVVNTEDGPPTPKHKAKGVLGGGNNRT